MRTGERLASVINTAKVKDALVAMTKARAGSCGVVDARGGVIGIFTDGDLRRYIPTHANLLQLRVSKVMSRDPITVSTGQLAIDVLRIYEAHNIDDLLVVDANKRLVGAVDIQDLPKLKIL
jgi:arabinose-5-phosphate isomerase